MSRACLLTATVGLLFVAACVHSTMERTGRMRLGTGSEGKAPIMTALPDGFEEVGVVSVRADGISTSERLERHLLRRASLMGCDGIIDVRVSAEIGGEAVCVKRREPLAVTTPKTYRVREPSSDLVERAKTGGDAGVVLYQVLAQVSNRPVSEREWPLRWYLETYPQSPFASDVSALFEEVTPMRASPSAASVRGAATP